MLYCFSLIDSNMLCHTKIFIREAILFDTCSTVNAIPMTVARLDDEFTPAQGVKLGYIDWSDKFGGSVRSLMTAVDHREVRIPVMT